MRRVKAETEPKIAPRRTPRRWLMRVLRLTGVVASLALLAGSGWWLNHTGTLAALFGSARAKTLTATGAAGLAVTDITVEGRHRQPPERLLAALGLGRGDPILALDLDLARARLEALPWVRTAAVERRLPGHVHVRIVEREPIALWQRSARFMLVDRDGVEIGPDIAGAFAHLPVIVGADAPQHAAALFAALAAEPDLAARVKAAVRVGNRRWNLRLDDIGHGIDIRLPETQASAAWRRLARLEREHGLLERRLDMIDLRQPDRLVVGAPPAPTSPAQPSKPAAKRRLNDKEA